MSGSETDATSPWELTQIDRLLGAVYEGPMESPPWQSALQILREQLQATHATLMLRSSSPGSAGFTINAGPATALDAEAHENRLFGLDRFMRFPEGKVVSAEELIGGHWLQSSVYQDYLKPLDVRHLLGVDFHLKEGIECRLRLTRSHAAQPFSDSDKKVCRLVLPHFERTIQMHARMDFLECERQLFVGTVKRMLVGIISFARDGSTIEINQEARRILAENDGARLSGNTLCADSDQESRNLRCMIRTALGRAADGHADVAGEGMAEVMSITRPSSRAKLGVLVRSIPLRPWSESKRRPAVVVFLRDPESNATLPSQELVRRLFGLTHTQARLALLLAEGLTLDQAAEQMKVRRNTARSHLRVIFTKTGVTRQTMLVRLILNSVLSLGLEPKAAA